MPTVNPPGSPVTVVYLTCRREPRFAWWARSLHRQTGGNYAGLRVVIVDFYAEAHREGDGWTAEQARARRAEFRELCPCPDYVHTTPIWNTWQGPHRLTREHWFAKADYLNAAVCYAPGDWLVSCDDLSVLMPGWLDAVREAVTRNNIVTCGAYRKVNCLAVMDGEVHGFRDHPTGIDRREARAGGRVIACRGNWMFGCSFAAPIDVLLRVNGWPQLSNGLGFEDSPNGLVIEKAGTAFVYDPRMMTWESEEDHHVGKPMVRSDYGQSPQDKSHAFLELANNTNRWTNFFGPEGLAGVRSRVLAGEPLPIIREPTHEWFTKRALSEL